MTVFVTKAAGQHDDFPAQLSAQIKERNKVPLINAVQNLQICIPYNIVAADSCVTNQR